MAKQKWKSLPWFVRKHLEKKARREAIRARDGDNCWRCGHPVRFGKPFNSGKAVTIEHKMPKALGGTDDLENLVLCHVGCNRHLGVNSPEQKERMRAKKAVGSRIESGMTR